MMFWKICKYELLNILRNRWIFAYFVVNAAMAYGCLRIAGDAAKAVVSLATISTVLLPLTSILFATLYWYFSANFTDLLLTQPVGRGTVYAARAAALCGASSLCYVAGVALPLLLFGSGSAVLLVHLACAALLSIIFGGLGSLIAVAVQDRMKGFGLALGTWFFYAVIYDAGVLILLIALKNYPMDLASAVIGTLNPIGLARVAQMISGDAAFLLGHTGALVRHSLVAPSGRWFAVGVAVAWLTVPWGVGLVLFRRRDF